MNTSIIAYIYLHLHIYNTNIFIYAILIVIDILCFKKNNTKPYNISNRNKKANPTTSTTKNEYILYICSKTKNYIFLSNYIIQKRE